MCQVFCNTTLEFYLKLYYIYVSTRGKLVHSTILTLPISKVYFSLSHLIYSGFMSLKFRYFTNGCCIYSLEKDLVVFIRILNARTL